MRQLVVADRIGVPVAELAKIVEAPAAQRPRVEARADVTAVAVELDDRPTELDQECS